MPERHPHLLALPIHASLPPQADSATVSDFEDLGAHAVFVDPIGDFEAFTEKMTGASKLCLLVDPLSRQITRNNALFVARSYIDAARAAGIEHVILLTPFSPWDPSTPPVTPTDKSSPTDSLLDEHIVSYRSQFQSIEAHLKTQFRAEQITIIRYPGILQQHLRFFSTYITTHNGLPFPNNPSMTIESCNMNDIVRACSYIAYSPTSRHGGKTFKITGPHLLTLQELMERLANNFNHPIRIDMMSIHDMRNVLVASLPNSDAVAYILEMWGLQERLAGFEAGTQKWEITRDLEALTGEGGVSLEDYLQSMLCDIDSKQKESTVIQEIR